MAAPRAGHHGTINQSSAFLIKNSLRFDGNPYLSRTPSSSGSRTTWTVSCWVKRATLGASQYIWSAGTSNVTYLNFQSNDTLKLRNGSGSVEYVTNWRFRDPNAWYHIVVKWDTTNGTQVDRAIIYVNGVELTANDYGQYDKATASENSSGWNVNVAHAFGHYTYNSGSKYQAYLSEVHFTDGTALDASYFGFTDPLTNTWKPKKYEGTYGTNGFYLDFSDSSDIGADRSGNGNNWTPNSFEVDDVVPDSPSGVTFSTTSPGVTISQPSNYCTLNPLDEGEFGGGLTVSDGNLKCVSTASDRHVRSTFFLPTSGKYYFEMIATVINSAGYLATGLYHSTGSLTSTAIATAQGRWYAATGYGNGSSWGATYDDRDLIGIAVDMDAGKIWASKNGVFQASGNPITGANAMYSDLRTAYSTIEWSPVCANWQTANTAEFNFGQFPMAYSPGTSSGTEYFNAVSYTGNGSTQSVTGIGFQPDLVWIKCRSVTTDHVLTDVVRGATKTVRSNVTNVEYTQSDALTSFDSDGFSLGDDNDGGVAGNFNINTRSYVAYCWKAGGTASANTDGTINSSVSANNDAGFSVVSFTGTGSAGTVGHGLDTAPSVIFLKNRDSAEGWRVYLSTLSSASKYLVLNTNAAEDTANSVWNGTAPTDSVFSVGDGTAVNNDGDDLVAYCWAEKTGVNRIGTYVGDGNAVGPAVDVGFKPAMVIIKKTDTASEWAIYDRTTTNAINGAQLRADVTDTENTNLAAKVILTNYGFKILTSDSAQNGDGVTYSYMAFAENFVPDERYKELCTANLPTPASGAAVRPDKYVGIHTYVGTGSEHDIPNAFGFDPDFLWTRRSDGTGDRHNWYDKVRGDDGTRMYVICPDATTSQATRTESTTAMVKSSQWPRNGFRVGTNGQTNTSGAVYTAFGLKAGGAPVTNTVGIITSQVSASPESGFSIIGYHGDQTTGSSIGHGLNQAPEMLIFKSLGETRNWLIWHKDLNAGAGDYYLYFSAAKRAQDTRTDRPLKDSGCVTDTTIILGSDSEVNHNDEMICYAFHSVPGVVKVGRYDGNGSTSEGPFVYCGFRPKFVIAKNYAGGSETNWFVKDAENAKFNPTQFTLYLNNSDARVNNFPIDFLSNGFKIKDDNALINESGSNYIYIAWAESPTNNLYGGQANAR